MPELVLFQLQRFWSSEKHGLARLRHLPDVAPVHAHERNCTFAGERYRMSERALREASESSDRHLASTHREFALAHAPEPVTCPSIGTL